MSIEVMKRIKSLLQDCAKIDSHTISAVVAECDMAILAKHPATGEPIKLHKECATMPNDERCDECQQPATPEPMQADSSEHLRVVASLGDALRRLSFAAQTTGGTTGPDAELQSAIGQAEQALSLGGIWQAMSAPGEPVKVAPYNPTEEMRWAMKRIDPALSSEQCRALWSAAWSVAPSTHPAPSVPDGLQWFTVAEHGLPEVGEVVVGGLWYTDPWLKPECATSFMWGQCRVVDTKHRDFKDGKQWLTFGPSHNQITHWARLNPPAMLAAKEPS